MRNRSWKTVARGIRSITVIGVIVLLAFYGPKASFAQDQSYWVSRNDSFGVFYRVKNGDWKDGVGLGLRDFPSNIAVSDPNDVFDIEFYNHLDGRDAGALSRGTISPQFICEAAHRNLLSRIQKDQGIELNSNPTDSASPYATKNMGGPNGYGGESGPYSLLYRQKFSDSYCVISQSMVSYPPPKRSYYFYTYSIIASGKIVRPGLPKVAQPNCEPMSLLGDWKGAIKDDGAGGLAGGTGQMVNQGLRFTSAGQDVAVEFSDGRYRMGWERRGILKLDPAAATAGQCRFQVMNNFSVAGRASLDLATSKLTYSNSQGVLQSLDGFVRGAVPPPEITCTPKDVEGTWIRGSDGARVGLGGMNFQGGGIGTVVSHPDPRWPKGSSKFKGVTQVASTCVYNARCVTTHANDQGGYIFTDEACTLTLDRAARSLTASAGHGVYSLNSPQ